MKKGFRKQTVVIQPSTSKPLDAQKSKNYRIVWRNDTKQNNSDKMFLIALGCLICFKIVALCIRMIDGLHATKLWNFLSGLFHSISVSVFGVLHQNLLYIVCLVLFVSALYLAVKTIIAYRSSRKLGEYHIKGLIEPVDASLKTYKAKVNEAADLIDDIDEEEDSYFRRALTILHELENHSDTVPDFYKMMALLTMAQAYNGLKMSKEALDCYNRAIAIGTQRTCLLASEAKAAYLSSKGLENDSLEIYNRLLAHGSFTDTDQKRIKSNIRVLKRRRFFSLDRFLLSIVSALFLCLYVDRDQSFFRFPWNFYRPFLIVLLITLFFYFIFFRKKEGVRLKVSEELREFWES